MFNLRNIRNTFLFIISRSAAKAQDVTSTPYSQFGLGFLQKNNSVINLGMGGISNGVRFDNAINTQNPASYSALQWTTFEIGTFAAFSEFKSSTNYAFRNNAALSYLKIGFPITQKWGASFGLVPVSGMGYESRVNTTILDTPATQVYKGSGGINQFFIGNAYQITENLSIGFNASYIFGNLEKTKASEFPDTLRFLNIKQTNSIYIGSIFLNYGIQYKRKLSDDKYFIIGLNGNPGSSLNAERNTTAIRYFYQNNVEQLVDTTQNTQNQQGKVFYPMLNSLGFTLNKQNKWMIGADLSLGNWSKFKVFEENQNLSNTLDVSIGGAITPNYMAVGNYFKTIEYRFGFNYNQSYVNILQESINQMNVSLGFGLPLPKTASRINLAVEFGKRGTLNKGLIEEKYIGVHAGFNFCDKWFIQRKYD